MYNMIEEVQPIELNILDKYLYFDDSDDKMMEESVVPNINDFVDNVDLLESMTHQDFSKLLSTYSLSPVTKQNYEMKFHKAKRITKRDKAKSRITAPCLKLLQPLSQQTSQSLGTKTEVQYVNIKQSKQQEQKKRKRMSAQLSRDKKKVYVQQIQRQNQELKQKCKQLEIQNQKLKTSSKGTFADRSNSLKGCLQKQKQIISIQSIPTQMFLQPCSHFQDIENLISEYEKYPMKERFLDLQKFKHFADFGQQKKDIANIQNIFQAKITDKFENSKGQFQNKFNNTLKKRIKKSEI